MNLKSYVSFVFTLGLFTVNLCAQIVFTFENFESEIMTYEPTQRNGVSDESFKFAKMVIRETKLSIKSDKGRFNRADYMNILTAFCSLDESQMNIDLAFKKLSESEGSCDYFTSFGKDLISKESFAPVKQKFEARIKECEETQQEEVCFDLASYSEAQNLDLDLLEIIQDIDVRDQYFRNGDFDSHISDQRSLDLKNQVKIDSLFDVYGSYVGRSLVGEKFEHTMWAVVQHSDEEMMKKYLPILKEAVQGNELALAPLKMTIDRYYSITEGYQIFGSQTGVDIVDDQRRTIVCKEYGISD